MDNETRHEIWIMTATSLLPIPVIAALAFFAVLQ